MKTLNVSIQGSTLMKSSMSHPLNLLCLRAHFLLILNWLFVASKDKLMNDPAFQLNQFISPKLKLKAFRDHIREKSNSSQPNVEFDRKRAVEVRDGVSQNFGMTLIGQFVSIYTRVSDFRNASDKPWDVSFTNEQGIDAGGPACELVSELAIDLCSPNCGLVVPVPNARNDVGLHRDCVIPLPNPAIENADKRYRCSGVVIAICVRTGLVQSFNFPPLFWEYMISETISIEGIFEIDENYAMLIQALKECQASGADDETFRTRLNHKFVVTDMRGNEVPLIQRGRLEAVTASNCARFISLANEFRINEIKQYLAAIRAGFWENLGIKPLPSLNWRTLEFAACGEREITVDALRKVTKFEGGINKTQQEIFWKVVENFTPDQRSLLLKFSTGRSRLPPITEGQTYLKIDSMGGTDLMPTSSTCFHQLHMPTYSSYDKALRLITVAIEYTGSFECR